MICPVVYYFCVVRIWWVWVKMIVAQTEWKGPIHEVYSTCVPGYQSINIFYRCDNLFMQYYIVLCILYMDIRCRLCLHHRGGGGVTILQVTKVEEFYRWDLPILLVLFFYPRTVGQYECLRFWPFFWLGRKTYQVQCTGRIIVLKPSNVTAVQDRSNPIQSTRKQRK